MALGDKTSSNIGSPTMHSIIEVDLKEAKGGWLLGE